MKTLYLHKERVDLAELLGCTVQKHKMINPLRECLLYFSFLQVTGESGRKHQKDIKEEKRKKEKYVSGQGKNGRKDIQFNFNFKFLSVL